MTGYSSISISLQLPPDLDQVLLVLYFPQVVQLLHQGEDFLDAEETLGLTHMGMGSVVEHGEERAELGSESVEL